MKKLLIILVIIALIILSFPLYIWWISLHSQANISYSNNSLPAEEIRRIHQFIQDSEQGPSSKRIELSEADLNQLIRYGSQKFNASLNIAGHVELHPDESRLLITIDTGLPLRPYLNAQINFTTQGKNFILLGGRIGGMELPQQSVEFLVNMTMPYAQRHPQYGTGTQLWQTIKAVTITQQKLTIDFMINQQLQAELQQRQLAIILGQDALNRLPLYQQMIEQSFKQQLGQRIKLHEVMKEIFSVAQAQLDADPVVDNKAILFALFLHTLEPDKAAMLRLGQLVALPVQPLELTIERRKDLAQHYLGSAVITLFANSAVADSIGLYKELQDQNGRSGFSVSDLIADRSGSLFASRLLDPATAKQLQQRIAASQSEADFFPQSRAIARQLEHQISQHQGNQQLIIDQVEQQIDQLANSVALYH